MSELSIFCDESGGEGGHSKYCLITLVFHDQSNPIDKNIEDYKSALSNQGLADIPLHATPLMRGNEQYAGMELADRKKLLMHFFIFQRGLPYRYCTFAYKRSEVRETAKFRARLRKDLVVLLEDNLEYFQGFDKVKIYYDGGQSMVTKALHDAFDYELSKEAVLYKDAKPTDYRLYQVADFICVMELVAIKFEHRALTGTDERFFGLSMAQFKKLYLRHIRKKRLG